MRSRPRAAEPAKDSGKGGLTLQVVPDGDGRVRTWVIPPRRLATLKRAGWGAGFALTLLVVLAFAGIAQTFRVRTLAVELAQVSAERDQLLRVEATLSEIEGAYRQLQTILGVGVPTAATWLPRPGSAAAAPSVGARSEEPGLPTLWPLTERGFLTRLLLEEETTQTEHPGIDIAIPSGSYIRSAGSGVVLETGEDPVYGLFVRVEHANGLETLYGHASAVVTEAGRAVRAGEVIAFVGSSGRSSAPHLHFEIRRDGVPVDPLTFVTRP